MRKRTSTEKLAHTIATMVLMLCCLLPVQRVHAASNPYSTARTSFANGDLTGAQKSLENVLFPKPKISGKQWEDATNLLGVCYFLLDQKPRARKLFQSVLARNPNAQLAKEDLLDPTLEGFYESLKSRSPAPKKVAGKTPRTPTPPTAASKPITGVILETNVKRATVFDSGIFVGSSGKTISLDPGSHNLTISSEGFLDENTTVSLREGQVKTIVIKLKPPAAPKVVAKKMEMESQSKKNPAKDNISYSGSLPGPKNGRNLADEFAQDSATMTRPPAPVQSFYPPPTQPLRPTYQQPVQPTYQQPVQPAYQQPIQPTYQQPMQPAYQQPMQPTYQQPMQPTYQQPMQPAYQQPMQPAYQQPMQPTYQQPVQPSYQAPAYAPPPLAPSHSQGTRTKYAYKKTALDKYPALGLLPLGVGQYANNEPIKGTLFASAQIGGAVVAYMAYAKEASFTAKEKAALATETEDDDFDPSSSKAYKNTQRTNQYIGYGIFGAGWLISIIDAMTHKPKSAYSRADILNEESTTDTLLASRNTSHFQLSLFSFEQGAGVNLHLEF
jgi:hypothetical protein